MDSGDLRNLDASLKLRIAYLVVGIIGLVGNLFVILVFGCSKSLRQTVINRLILNQSVLDFTASLFIILTTFIRGSDHFNREIVCRLWLNNLPIWGLFVSSTYNLVLLALERYFAIVHPLKIKWRLTPKKAYIFMVIIWILGPAYNAAYMVPTSGIKNDTCTVFTEYPSESTKRITGILIVLIQFLIPLGSLLFTYGRILLAMKNLQTSVHISGHRNKRTSRATRNIIQTLLLVSACFVFCWSWNQVTFLIFNLGYKKLINFNGTFYHFTVIAVFCNCCFNPIIYTFNYEQFQRAAKVFLRRMKGEGNGASSTTAAHTANNPLEAATQT